MFLFKPSKEKLYKKAMEAFNKKDYLNSIPLFEKAAEMELPEAYFMLGKIYDSGLGTYADKNKALAYFSKAANLGYEEAKDKVNKLQTESILLKAKELEDSNKLNEARNEYIKLYNSGYEKALLDIIRVSKGRDDYYIILAEASKSSDTDITDYVIERCIEYLGGTFAKLENLLFREITSFAKSLLSEKEDVYILGLNPDSYLNQKDSYSFEISADTLTNLRLTLEEEESFLNAEEYMGITTFFIKKEQIITITEEVKKLCKKIDTDFDRYVSQDILWEIDNKMFSISKCALDRFREAEIYYEFNNLLFAVELGEDYSEAEAYSLSEELNGETGAQRYWDLLLSEADEARKRLYE